MYIHTSYYSDIVMVTYCVNKCFIALLLLINACIYAVIQG